jgi:hypothetical protein
MTSPSDSGILDSFGLPMSWIPLDLGKNVEFERLGGTSRARGKTRTSLFVRFSPDDAPLKIFSDPVCSPGSFPKQVPDHFISRSTPD